MNKYEEAEKRVEVFSNFIKPYIEDIEKQVKDLYVIAENFNNHDMTDDLKDILKEIF